MNIAAIKTEPLAAELRSRGYLVAKEKPDDWLTLTALAKKCGVSVSSLHRTLDRHPSAPGLTCDTAPTGKRRAVLATPEFHAWFAARRGADWKGGE